MGEFETFLAHANTILVNEIKKEGVGQTQEAVLENLAAKRDERLYQGASTEGEFLPVPGSSSTKYL